jgi:polar amino acid transport system substrate-binding protein
MMKVSSILGSLLACTAGYVQAAGYVLEYYENPPFAQTEAGKPAGVAVSIVTQMFERAKLPFKLEAAPLARGMADAKSKPDVCVFPVQRAQSNEADYSWVSPILITTSGLFTHPDSKEQFITLADARKLRVGALRGSGDAEYLKSFGFTVDEANAQEQNLEKLLGKRIDIWATDVLSANYFVKKSNNKDRAPREALDFRRSLGSLACNVKMPKADVAKLQGSLDAMIKDGTVGKLTAF